MSVNLVMTTNEKRIIERYPDSDSAILRFEEAKHFNGVCKLFMTFSDGSSWSWSDNEMQIQRPRSSGLDGLLSDAYQRCSQTSIGGSFEHDYVKY